MASEKTPLLNGYVLIMPKGDDLPRFGQLVKGLSLEELMPYEMDPWWQNLRRTIMSLFWTVVLVMFASGCVMAALDHSRVHCSAGQTMDGAATILNGTNSTASSLPNIAAIGL